MQSTQTLSGRIDPVEEGNEFWIKWATCLTLGVGAGWLLWPILGVALASYAAFRYSRGKAGWPFIGAVLAAAGLSSYWIASQEGGLLGMGSQYVRLQWELVLIGQSYFLSATQAPAGSILADHLRQIPTLAVSLAFGPLLGILLAVSAPPVSSPDSSAGSLPATREGDAGGKKGEETKAPEEPRWYTGVDFAELDPGRKVLIWGYGVQCGAVTGWIGAPKVGKSEAYTQLIGCCVLGVPLFLGVPVYATSVVVLAEETAEVYQDKALTAAGWLEAFRIKGPWWLRPVRLAPRRIKRKLRRVWLRVRKEQPRDIHVLCGKEIPGAKSIDTFPIYLEMARKRAAATGSRLIVVDSLNFWVPEAITNDKVAKLAAGYLSHIASLGFAVLIVHHMNKKGDMAGPDSLYSQLDFRVDCTVPGDADPRTTDVRQLLWSGRFKRDYPAELRMLIYHMVKGRLVKAGGKVRITEATPVIEHEGSPGEGAPPDPDAALDPMCRHTLSLLRDAAVAAPGAWHTADQIVGMVRDAGKYKSEGRIRESVKSLVAAGRVDQDKERGVRNDPVRYRPHVEAPESPDSGDDQGA